jgi:hypothetical protein
MRSQRLLPLALCHLLVQEQAAALGRLERLGVATRRDCRKWSTQREGKRRLLAVEGCWLSLRPRGAYAPAGVERQIAALAAASASTTVEYETSGSRSFVFDSLEAVGRVRLEA